MRLGIILTSHALDGGSSLAALDDETLAAFAKVGLKLVTKTEKTVDTPYDGKVSLLEVVLEQPPCYPIVDRGLQHTLVFLQRHSMDGDQVTPP